MSAAKRFSLLLPVLLVLTVNSIAQNVLKQSCLIGRLGEEYPAAGKLASGFRAEILECSSLAGEDPKLMESIIFPELLRYNSLYDAVQIGSLVVLYTHWGEKYADFSIGYFQMKPSFAEMIERIASKSRARWVKDLGFDLLKVEDSFENRRLRVERLRDVSWQVKYLAAFIKICRAKYKLKRGSEDDVCVFATAYNAGFHRPLAELKVFQSKELFFTGPLPQGERFNYSSIALARFRELRN